MGILLFDFDRRCLEFRSSPGEGQFTPLVRRQKTLLMLSFSSGTLSAQFAWAWSASLLASRPRTQLVAMLRSSFKLAHTLGK